MGPFRLSLQPDALVTVRAEKFCPDTTSNVAAGIFRPSPAFRYRDTSQIGSPMINPNGDNWLSFFSYD